MRPSQEFTNLAVTDWALFSVSFPPKDSEDLAKSFGVTDSNIKTYRNPAAKILRKNRNDLLFRQDLCKNNSA